MERVSKLKGLFLLGGILGAFGCGAEADEGAGTRPVIADNGDLRVAAAEGETAIVSVRSRAFEDMSDLFEFAIEEMGGEAVYDEAGKVIRVQGVSIAAGKVRYRDEDTGETFDAVDLAQAYLGGAAGAIEVAGQRLQIKAPLTDIRSTTAALTDNSESCVGDDCITGHSWKTNYLVYRSVGSETKQSSGGYSPYTYSCCRGGGSLVSYQGRQQCRYVTEWEPADPELGQYKPIPVSYGYRPVDTCTGTTTRNSLTLGVTAISPSGFRSEYASRTETNTREVKMSAWGVGLGVSFLGIDDVDGVCGFHTGNRGGTSRTRAGSATDAQCEPQTGGWFLQSASFGN